MRGMLLKVGMLGWLLSIGSATYAQSLGVRVTGTLSGPFERISDGEVVETTIALVPEEEFQGERKWYILPNEEYTLEITATDFSGGLTRLAVVNEDEQEVASTTSEAPTDTLTLRTTKPAFELVIPIPFLPEGWKIGVKFEQWGVELQGSLTGAAQYKNTPSTLTVTVLNRADNKPIPYAFVWFYASGKPKGAAIETGLDGKATFSVAPRSDYILEVAGPSPSCHLKIAPVEILPGTTHVRNVSIYLPHGGVRGRIALTNVFPAEVVLKVYKGGQMIFQGGAIEGPLDEEGFYTYTLPPFEAGMYTLKTLVGGEEKASGLFTVPNDCNTMFPPDSGYEVIGSAGAHQVVNGPTLFVTVGQGGSQPPPEDGGGTPPDEGGSDLPPEG